VEVFSEQLHNQGEYRKVTQASLTYVAIDAHGRPRSIQKTAVKKQAFTTATGKPKPKPKPKAKAKPKAKLKNPTPAKR
jgi:acyl-CoA hydrolase